MQLLNPGALWYLALALVVLLVRRRRARRHLVVSNLYLWHEALRPERMQFAFTRIRRHWLALLQAAVIIAAIAALARPVVSWQPPRVVFIVDVSASMGAREHTSTRLQQAKARALDVLRGLPARAMVRVVAAGPTPTDLGEYVAVDPALVRGIESLDATAGTSDLEAALETVVAPPEGAPDTYVFSDMVAPEPRAARAYAGRRRWVTVGRPAQNTAITALTARRVTATHPGGQVFVQVWNHGADARQVDVELTQDDVEIARLPLALGPNASGSLIVDVPRLDGVLRARVRHDDALAVDDERFAVVPSGAPIRVLLSTAGSFFLEKALAANPDVQLDVVAPSSNVQSSASTYDVVVCDLCSTVPDVAPGVLLIVPAPPATGPFAPLSIGAAVHPVAASLDLGDGLVAPLAAAADPVAADVILRVGDARAVVAYERDGQRVVQVHVDLASSGLSMMTAFPVLMANAIDWLASRDATPRHVPAGRPLSWTVKDPRMLEGVAVEGPDGRAVTARVAARHLTITDTASAGVYRVRGRQWTDAFAVTPDTDTESDLTRPVTAVAQDRVATTPALDRVETPLSTLLTAVALACLMTEWWYRCRRSEA